MSRKNEIAKTLLETGAVKLNVSEPFTFVSGIKSPIYCDNRKIIGYPQEREKIVEGFVEFLRTKEFDVVAGTATAGIPWASFVAMKLDKPMSYIRGEKKAHGAGRQIEGAEVKDKKVIVIEDLISTGKSSINAVEGARQEGASSVEVISIFSYEFKSAYENFSEKNIAWTSLSNFDTLLEEALKNKYLSEEEIEIAGEWNKNPKEWGV